MTQARAPRVAHRSEQALHRGRLGRRVQRLVLGLVATDAVGDRADAPGRHPRVLEDRLDQVCRRRLAVGSGDADDQQIAARIAVVGRGQRRERRARIRHPNPRVAPGRPAASTCATTQRGTPRTGFVGESPLRRGARPARRRIRRPRQRRGNRSGYRLPSRPTQRASSTPPVRPFRPPRAGSRAPSGQRALGARPSFVDHRHGPRRLDVIRRNRMRRCSRIVAVAPDSTASPAAGT